MTAAKKKPDNHRITEKRRKRAMEAMLDRGDLIRLQGSWWWHNGQDWIRSPDKDQALRVAADTAADILSSKSDRVSPLAVAPRQVADLLAKAEDVLRVAEVDDRLTADPELADRIINLKTGATKRGVLWADKIVHVADDGRFKGVIADPERSKWDWSARPAIPWKWGDGQYGATPEFDKLIEVMLDRDAAAADWLVVQIGRTLTESADHHGLGLLIGPGGTGKSTFLDILSGLVGHAATVTRGSISELAGRFNDDLTRARLLVMPDLAGTDKGGQHDYQNGLARLKQLTVADKIKIEAKYRGSSAGDSRRLPLTVWAASNHPPEFTRVAADYDAWNRRVIPFSAKGRPPVRVPGLADRILATEGRDIAVRAVTTWAEYIRDEYPEPEMVTRQRKAIMTSHIAPVERWWAEEVTAETGRSVTVHDLKTAYGQWCSREGVDPGKDGEWPGETRIPRLARNAAPATERKDFTDPNTGKRRQTTLHHGLGLRPHQEPAEAEF